MTGPVTTEALVASLREANERFAKAEIALQQVTAERDEDRAEHARYRASAEEMWETAKRHGGQMLAEKRRADAAEASLATATSELARLRAEGEADLEACAQHCEGYAALNADEATRRGKWLGEEKAARDEKCAALWATHHAANEMAGFIRDRIKSRTALTRSATAKEG